MSHSRRRNSWDNDYGKNGEFLPEFSPANLPPSSSFRGKLPRPPLPRSAACVMVYLMAATQISEMRAPHDAVLDHLLAHPFWTLKQLAAATGYSVSWLSQMIRSDCFQQAYQARRGDIESGIMAGIGERLNALAHLAIDNMEEVLTSAVDAETKIDAFDKVLHRTGYAPNSAKSREGASDGNTFVQNNFYMDRKELEELQGRILEGSASPQPALPLEVPKDA